MFNCIGMPNYSPKWLHCFVAPGIVIKNDILTGVWCFLHFLFILKYNSFMLC